MAAEHKQNNARTEQGVENVEHYAEVDWPVADIPYPSGNIDDAAANKAS